MTFVKQNVSVKEFMMHEYIYILSKDSKGVLNVPEIFDYSVETQVMTMGLIPHMCVSDYYGEAAKNIHVDLFDQIREVVRYLYTNHIIYPDITGYNFIECEGKLWIIDFEHADFKTREKDIFVEEFVNDDECCEWNPWFT
jgi:tRNA A-37 threonylcarbamoyl transferase component Bud32